MFRRRANVSISGTPIVLDDNQVEPRAYDINSIPVVDKVYYGISAKYQVTVSYRATQRLSGATYELEADGYTEKAIKKGLPFDRKIQRDLVILKVDGKYVGWGFIFDSDTALFNAKGAVYPQDFELPPSQQDIIDEYLAKGMSVPGSFELKDILKKRQLGGVLNSRYLSPYFGGNPSFYVDSPERTYVNIPTIATPIKVVKSSATQKVEKDELERIEQGKKMSTSFTFELDPTVYIIFNKPGRGKIYLEDLLTKGNYGLLLESSSPNQLTVKAESIVFYLSWTVSSLVKRFMTELKVYAIDTVTGNKSPVIDLKSGETGISLSELKKVLKIGEWFEKTVSQPGREALKSVSVPQVVQEPIFTKPIEPILPKPTRKPIKPIVQEPIVNKPTRKPTRKPTVQQPKPKNISPLDAFEESLYVLNADVDFDNIQDNELYTVIAELKSSTDSMPKTQELEVWTDLLRLTLKELNSLYDLGDLNPGESQEVLSYLKPILDNIPMSFSKKAFLRYFR